MPFSPVPTESKSQINKAGQVLVQDNASSQDLDRARDLADRWRACHAYPINTFQATLRAKLRKFDSSPIAAQRLKRMPTIIDKLKRYPAMKLTTMQDIGGIRAILNSVGDVEKLADEYRRSRRLAHALITERDYVRKPRSEDGYRSLHLVYRYTNKRAPQYEGLRVELQIRTKLQHTWATAVETMGTFLGQALKSRQGDQKWLDFFAAVSSAFARKEDCPPVPRFGHLSASETIKAVAASEGDLQALDTMTGISVAANTILRSAERGKAWFYHLIVLDSPNRRVEIRRYDRDSFAQALSEYTAVEARAAGGERIEPVLVSAGPIDQVRRAYPNFFLDINEFVKIVRQILRL